MLLLRESTLWEKFCPVYTTADSFRAWHDARNYEIKQVLESTVYVY